MATGALGSVSNRLRHENGDTHVVICDDVFSDAGSTPAASTTFSAEITSFDSFFPPPPLFLHEIYGRSSNGLIAQLQESYRRIQRRRTQMHIPLRRRQVLMTSQFLNRPGRRAAHGQVRTERVTQDMDTRLYVGIVIK